MGSARNVSATVITMYRFIGNHTSDSAARFELCPSTLRLVAIARVPQRRADVVEIAQGFSKGLDYAGLAIRDRARLTERSHCGLCPFELVPGHLGEEVMLNLIVQSTKPEVCHGVRSDVSGREDLLS